jgi:hypothetical protein
MTALPSALIEQLAASGGAAQPADLAGWLETQDPRTRAIAQLLATMRSADSAPSEDAQSAAVQAQAREERLRRRLHAMRDELEGLREVNDTLAAALGACHLCWGCELHCLHCGGSGTPGGMAPDRALFEQFILPAVRRLNRDRGRAADPVVPSQQAEQAGRRSA